MRYRPDIDGLRGIAVGAVVFFHAGFDTISGGYVGVDIFFVISGYLITTIIRSGLDKGKFSLMEFYERRARRILPALLLILAVTWGISYWTLLPNNFVNYSESSIATLLFVSNLFFWKDGGYFAAPAEGKPLLHTWSLAVEEQFYVLWPAFLIVGYRHFKSAVKFIIFSIALLSFMLSVYGVFYYPDSTFYLTPTRIWELLIGCLLAFEVFPYIKRKIVQEVLALLGALLIGFSVVFFTSRTIFPGATALFPCIGAALIIWSGVAGSTLVNRMLSLRPIVFVGLISYSFYLWHWPVFVFYKAVFPLGMENAERFGLIVLAGVLAVFSWKFVELPARRRDGFVTFERLIGCVTVASCSLLAVGIVTIFTKGMPERIPATALALAAGRADFGIKGDKCLDMPIDRVRSGRICQLGSTKHQIGFIVWGDSHAEGMAAALATLSDNHGTAGLYAGRRGCPPLLGVSHWIIKSHNCLEFNQAMLDLIASGPVMDVVLIGRWNVYANGWPNRGIESKERPEFFIADVETKKVSSAENKLVLERGLYRTISFLAPLKKRIWLIEEVPYVGFDVPSVLAQLFIFGTFDAFLGPLATVHDDESLFIRSLIKTLENRMPIVGLNPAAQLCSQSRCRVSADNRALYRDDDHLSVYGANWIAQVFKPIFEAPKTH